jgi:hypothetical protein
MDYAAADMPIVGDHDKVVDLRIAIDPAQNPRFFTHDRLMRAPRKRIAVINALRAPSQFLFWM